MQTDGMTATDHVYLMCANATDQLSVLRLIMIR